MERVVEAHRNITLALTFAVMTIVCYFCAPQLQKYGDRWKQPYLQTENYPLTQQCLKYDQLDHYLPSICVQSKFEVRNGYYLHSYDLPQFGRMSSGWFRLGNDAVLVSKGREIQSIRPNVFGQGKYKY